MLPRRPTAPGARGGDAVAMRIRDWPMHDRPRERLLAVGAGALGDAELLALCLRTG
ncbi:MAG: UPF0758 domain-containing protein, partial [Arenimonas sp.]